MIGFIYSLVHLFLGILVALWTIRRLKRGGYTDGCEIFLIAFVAFIFWPLVLAVLLVLAMIDFVRGDD